MAAHCDPLSLSLPDEAATRQLGRALQELLRAGDTVLLEGDIGAGKTSLARALIEAGLLQPEDIPSPTFTLVQTYNTAHGEIWHCDLYRLTDPDELFELALDMAMEEAICLIEWPDRMGDARPENALTLSLVTKDRGRTAILVGDESWQPRLQKMVAELAGAHV